MNDLSTHIKNIITEKGPIPFVDFMQQALYAPNIGYYHSNLLKIGRQGDFITAPELTPLFGYTLAKQCADVFRKLSNPMLFEFGAGSGRLCVDILTKLEALDALPHQYYILDVSGQLKARQHQLIQQAIPHLAHKVIWLSSWPTTPFNGVIIANEVLDAMPVNRFLKADNRVYEVYIALNDENELVEVPKPCHTMRLAHHVNQLPIDASYYQSEVNLFIDDWVSQCYAMLMEGVVLVFDYGFPRHEYYHPDRHQGTLMCHYRQTTHANPLIHLGEQDITAHVDFTHVAEAGLNAGFELGGYTHQAAFLLSNDLLALAQDSEVANNINTQQAIKILLQPQEMGELFKVIALKKKVNLSLNGFKLSDKRASLG